ncbi:hypothetical protein L7F22_062596 [Adiantum nelumboides]|nr:hypothetical protein [Adiantum nelumboides]
MEATLCPVRYALLRRTPVADSLCLFAPAGCPSSSSNTPSSRRADAVHCPQSVVPVLTFSSRPHANAVQGLHGTSVGQITRLDRSAFEVVYHLLSVRFNARIRVKTYADEVTPCLVLQPSSTVQTGMSGKSTTCTVSFSPAMPTAPDSDRLWLRGPPTSKRFPPDWLHRGALRRGEEACRHRAFAALAAFRNFEPSSPWEQVGTGTSQTLLQYRLSPYQPPKRTARTKK